MNLNQNRWKGNWNHIKDKKAISCNTSKSSSTPSNKTSMPCNSLNPKETQSNSPNKSQNSMKSYFSFKTELKRKSTLHNNSHNLTIRKWRTAIKKRLICCLNSQLFPPAIKKISMSSKSELNPQIFRTVP